jgi:hypothetical protein
MNKCEKCGFLHYRTDPCSKPKEPPASAVKSRARQPRAETGHNLSETGVARDNGISGRVGGAVMLDRNKSRHRPGYFTEYMRKYRASSKASKPIQ